VGEHICKFNGVEVRQKAWRKCSEAKERIRRLGFGCGLREVGARV
jgi:hypothetical protein